MNESLETAVMGLAGTALIGQRVDPSFARFILWIPIQILNPHNQFKILSASKHTSFHQWREPRCS